MKFYKNNLMNKFYKKIIFKFRVIKTEDKLIIVRKTLKLKINFKNKRIIPLFIITLRCSNKLILLMKIYFKI